MGLGHVKLDVYYLAIGYCVKEDSIPHGIAEIDFDPDSDFDSDENISQQVDAKSRFV
jgi:hypothetical protein